MKARLLSTVAAATLLFAAGAASAQDMKKDESPSRAPAAQQRAPAEKMSPTMKPGEHKAGVKPSGTVGQAPKAPDVDRQRSSDSMDKSMDKAPGAKSSSGRDGGADMKGQAEMKGKAHDSTTQAPADAGSRSSQSNKADKTEKGATTGQGAAAGSAKLSGEQRTKITTVIKRQKVQRVEPSKLNISISVGARVPSSVRFYPLPSEVFVIYPEWRGYDYILVDDEILVLDPRTHQIVAILDA